MESSLFEEAIATLTERKNLLKHDSTTGASNSKCIPGPKFSKKERKLFASQCKQMGWDISTFSEGEHELFYVLKCIIDNNNWQEQNLKAQYNLLTDFEEENRSLSDLLLTGTPKPISNTQGTQTTNSTNYMNPQNCGTTTTSAQTDITRNSISLPKIAITQSQSSQTSQSQTDVQTKTQICQTDIRRRPVSSPKTLVAHSQSTQSSKYMEIQPISSSPALSAPTGLDTMSPASPKSSQPQRSQTTTPTTHQSCDSNVSTTNCVTSKVMCNRETTVASQNTTPPIPDCHKRHSDVSNYISMQNYHKYPCFDYSKPPPSVQYSWIDVSCPPPGYANNIPESTYISSL